jgi:hypothetical protein
MSIPKSPDLQAFLSTYFAGSDADANLHGSQPLVWHWFECSVNGSILVLKTMFLKKT